MEKGHCFDNSLKALMSLTEEAAENYKLIHAWVTTQDKTFAHGWVEYHKNPDDVVVLDFAKNPDKPVVCDADEFYKLLNVTGAKVYSYTEGLVKAARSGHFGPWDLDLTNATDGVKI